MGISEEQLILRVRAVGFPETEAQTAALKREIGGLGDTAALSGEKARGGFGLFSRGVGGLAAAVGISGVAIGLKDLVHAGMDYQKQSLQLQAALDEIGIHSKAAFDQARQSVESLSTHGGFVRPEEIQSLTNFIGQLKSVRAAQQAMTATVELARAKGLQWGQAQMAVSRALAGNTTRLAQYVNYVPQVKQAHADLQASYERHALAIREEYKSYGPSYHQQEALALIALKKKYDLQVSGADAADKAATAQQILNSVTSQYPESLHKYNQGVAGMASNLKNSFVIMVGQIGNTILPAVRVFLSGLRSVFEYIDHHRWVLVAVAGASGLVGVGLALTMVVKGFGMLFKAATSGFKSLFLLAKGLTGVATTSRGAYTQADAMKAAMAGLDKETLASIKSMGGFTDAEVAAATEARRLQAQIVQNTEAVAAWRANMGSAAAGTMLDGEMMAGGFTVATAAEDEMTVSTGLLSAALDMLPFMVIFTAIGIGLDLLMTHWKQVSAAIVTGWHWMESTAKTVGHAIGHGFESAIHGIVVAWHAVEHAVKKAIDFMVDKVKWALNNTPLGTFFHLASGVAGGFGKLLHGDVGGAFSSVAHGVGGALHSATFGLLAGGGPVRSKYFDGGGPVGTDTVPGWLSPGEYVLNSALTKQIGANTLHNWTAGGYKSENIQISSTPVVLNVDGRQLARAVVRYTLERAARGPSSLTGGSLVTGSGFKISSPND